jgi:hypothetical protein
MYFAMISCLEIDMSGGGRRLSRSNVIELYCSVEEVLAVRLASGDVEMRQWPP